LALEQTAAAAAMNYVIDAIAAAAPMQCRFRLFFVLPFELSNAFLLFIYIFARPPARPPARPCNNLLQLCAQKTITTITITRTYQLLSL
jgi:hypothetical protein